MSVYFVTCREANAVKIGSSVEPRARLPEIQFGCPLQLTLEAVLPGGFEEEFTFHARFADDRIRGEWFRLTDMIEAIIAANPLTQAEATPPPVTREQLQRAERERRKLAEHEAVRLSGARIDPRKLSKIHRRRIASGDIIFPFRGEAA